MCSPWCAAFSRAAKLRVRQVIVGRHCNARCQHTGQDFRDVVSHKETTIVGALCDVSFVVEKLDHSPTAPSMWNNSSVNDVWVLLTSNVTFSPFQKVVEHNVYC